MFDADGQALAEVDLEGQVVARCPLDLGGPVECQRAARPPWQQQGVDLDLAGARPEAADHVKGQRLGDVRGGAREQARDAGVALVGVDAAIVVAILDAVRHAVAVAVASPRVGLAGVDPAVAVAVLDPIGDAVAVAVARRGNRRARGEHGQGEGQHAPA